MGRNLMDSKEIKVVEIPLNAASVEEHCNAIVESGEIGFWWYQGFDRVSHNFAVPFKGRAGSWWYQIKHGFCWPVDIYQGFDQHEVKLKYSKSYLGYQFQSSNPDSSNSCLYLNTIKHLKTYDEFTLNSKRRNKIRKGLSYLSIERLKVPNPKVIRTCCDIWNDVSQRTGWKKKINLDRFYREWLCLLECPGTNILLAREKRTSEIVGFYIVKIIGNVAYSDTIAVKSDKVSLNVNETMRFVYLVNAKKIKGVTQGSSSLVSNLENLEKFKRSLGFEPVALPAVTVFRPFIYPAMSIFTKKKLKRIIGKY
jgi:hypothetical protein